MPTGTSGQQRKGMKRPLGSRRVKGQGHTVTRGRK